MKNFCERRDGVRVLQKIYLLKDPLPCRSPEASPLPSRSTSPEAALTQESLSNRNVTNTKTTKTLGFSEIKQLNINLKRLVSAR